MKDIEFMDRIRERVDMDIEDIANEERTRPDSKANKLLKKFQKWEQFLLEEIEKKEELLSDSYLQQRNNIQQSNRFKIIYSINRFAKARGFFYRWST